MKLRRQLTLFSIATLATIPFASAATGFRALDSAIEMISGVFFPSIIQRSQTVQIGFFKFLYFIIIFAVVNWVLNSFVFKNDGSKDNNSKRTSGIVAFSMSAISAFFMPAKVALGTAGIITAIFNMLIPLGLAIGAIYLAFWQFGNKGDEKAPWWKHLLGAFILLIAITIISWAVEFMA